MKALNMETYIDIVNISVDVQYEQILAPAYKGKVGWGVDIFRYNYFLHRVKTTFRYGLIFGTSYR